MKFKWSRDPYNPEEFNLFLDGRFIGWVAPNAVAFLASTFEHTLMPCENITHLSKRAAMRALQTTATVLQIGKNYECT